MKNTRGEDKIREVIEACSDCDVCRNLMEADCLFFPELYRLWDREQQTGEPLSSSELRALTDRCNFCSLCPCPNIRADIITAKTEFVARDGLERGVRTIEDIERIGKVCGTFPKTCNLLLRQRWSGALLKQAFGIHPDRKFPEFSRQDFGKWARERRLHVRRNPGKGKKVAYFVGCTGRYLYPEVPMAAVEVLQASAVEVFVPEQKCCSMPALLEGDRKLALDFARFNINQLADAVDAGYDIVCSCSTCGFMLKNLLKEGAYYSDEYQRTVEGDKNLLKVPAGGDLLDSRQENGFVLLQKSIYGKILKDEGYFSCFSARDRVRIAEHTYDLGEYLQILQESGELPDPGYPVRDHLVYFPPCHARQQNIGQPYVEILSRIPNLQLESIDGHFNCCGMAGIMGFKREFHESAIRLGQRLMDKIERINPGCIVTDCLSCRLQFNQCLRYPVAHPIEVLRSAFTGR